MLTLEEIRRRLRGETITHVSEATGLHYNTVRFLRDGRQDNPTLRVMVALSRYFKEKDATLSASPKDDDE
ncbi:hypothetical protein [uncultured Halomonas sp.]|uniref:hypothetical protein n=1 Tax=uncultured Halomonas sp. TaxID=173971 RepID=UPI00263731B2|nr:hypothetical protein [uncultured Halomonas sp.]